MGTITPLIFWSGIALNSSSIAMVKRLALIRGPRGAQGSLNLYSVSAIK